MLLFEFMLKLPFLPDCLLSPVSATRDSMWVMFPVIFHLLMLIIKRSLNGSSVYCSGPEKHLVYRKHTKEVCRRSMGELMS